MKALDTYYGFRRAYSITWKGHFGHGLGRKRRDGVTRMGEGIFCWKNWVKNKAGKLEYAVEFIIARISAWIPETEKFKRS
jgi:hypothetical protein